MSLQPFNISNIGDVEDALKLKQQQQTSSRAFKSCLSVLYSFLNKLQIWSGVCSYDIMTAWLSITNFTRWLFEGSQQCHMIYAIVLLYHIHCFPHMPPICFPHVLCTILKNSQNIWITLLTYIFICSRTKCMFVFIYWWQKNFNQEKDKLYCKNLCA